MPSHGLRQRRSSNRTMLNISLPWLAPNVSTAAATAAPSGTTIMYKPVIGSDTMVIARGPHGATLGDRSVHVSAKYMCITTMPQYASKCLEELRLDDYRAGRRACAPASTIRGLPGPTASVNATNAGFLGSTATQQQSTVGTSTTAREALSGTIVWEFDKDSLTCEATHSYPVIVGEMSWTVSMIKFDTDEHARVYLSLMEGDYKVESVAVTVESKLFNLDDDSKTLMCKGSDSLEPPYSFLLWHIGSTDEVFDAAKGYIKDNKISGQVDFSLSEIKRFRKLRRMDFSDPNEPSHDVTLVIDGEKIYVNKQILAVHSPVFHRMFNGNFKEKTEKEIELKEIDHRDFVKLLRVIYPPAEPINYANVSCLLKLGDRYEIDWIMDQCEQFLITADVSLTSVSAKLDLAGRYRLSALQESCIERLKTAKDVKDLKSSKEAKDFSDAIKLALYDKMIEISD